ncbi:MAG: hypothetical protein FI714_06730 [SAR202 cluster bacterium]|nr:hypothetical protein [SAR202 cluster bacterium]
MVPRKGFEEKVGSNDLVDKCLDLTGPIEGGDETQPALDNYTDVIGDIDLSTDKLRTENAAKVRRMIQLIVSTQEYRFA